MTVRTAATAEEWETFSSATFVPVHVEAPPTRFLGTMDHRGNQRAGITSLSTGSCRIIRTRDLLSESSEDMALFSLQLKGSNDVEQAGRQAHIREGGSVLYLSRSPYELNFPDASELAILQVPVEWYGMSVSSMAALAAKPLQVGSDPALRTYSRLLRSMFGEAPIIDDATEAVRVATEILVAALRRKNELPVPGWSHTALFASFDRVIHDHLDDPYFGVRALAVAENVSVRTVHQVFNERGLKAASRIRGLRMERAKRLLTDTNLPIPDVAVRCGIADASVFSRTFRAHQDTTPTNFRRANQTLNEAAK